jgi:hypothetical protein
MGISCQEFWRDISDYIDEELEPLQQAALDQHFAECRHCTALLEGMRNVIVLYRDERLLAAPDGFHERLYQRLGESRNTSPVLLGLDADRCCGGTPGTRIVFCQQVDRTSARSQETRQRTRCAPTSRDRRNILGPG